MFVQLPALHQPQEGVNGFSGGKLCPWNCHWMTVPGAAKGNEICQDFVNI